MTSRQSAPISMLERALQALEKLETKLAATERVQTEPIALVGMACRFPGGVRSPRALWDLLQTGTYSISELPAERLIDSNVASTSPARWGGILDGIDQFDAGFFGLGRDEVMAMDPQHRLLLEVAWEAIEDAAIPQAQMKGSKTGVFVGISSRDYLGLLSSAGVEWTPYVSTGNASALAAGRIAYTFGFDGPCLCVDTACSSSLVAIHLASQSLRRRECDFAIVAGANLLLSAQASEALAALQILSPDGRCRTFDARANGYVRSEGVAAILLERFSDAERRADRTRALIRATAMNQNGRSASLTAPSVRAQIDVIQSALAGARILPENVGYVEVHSNGSPMGDPIELAALREALGKPRTDGSKCVLGSVKTHIGHAEAASGMAALIKTALIFEHGTIPRNLHFESLNPNATLAGTPFVIPVEEIAWPRGKMPRIAGVSSTGLSGANVHAVLEEPPVSLPTPAHPSEAVYLFAFSAKTPAALRDYADSLLSTLSLGSDVSVGDICHTLGTGRTHFEHRYAAVVASRANIISQLTSFIEGIPDNYAAAPVKNFSARKRIGFLLSGSFTEARNVLAAHRKMPPAFRDALRRGDDLVNALIGRRVVDETRDAMHGQNVQIDDELALFVVQYALVEFWRSCGVEPFAVLGEGTGECVAACVAGMLDLASALRLAVARARFVHDDTFGTAAFTQFVAMLQISEPALAIFSATGSTVSATELATAAYWERQLRMAPEFPKALTAFASQGYTAIVGISPPIDVALDKHRGAHSIVHSLVSDQQATEALFNGLCELYVRGIDLRWEGIESPYKYRKMELPTYPFQRQSYWFARKSTTENDVAEIPISTGHPMLGEPLEMSADRPDTHAWSISVDAHISPYLVLSDVDGLLFVSSTGVVDMACAAARELFGEDHWQCGFTVHECPRLSDEGASTMQLVAKFESLRHISMRVFFRSRKTDSWRELAYGDARVNDLSAQRAIDLQQIQPVQLQNIPASHWVERLEFFGAHFDVFRVTQLWRNDDEVLAQISLDPSDSTRRFLHAAVGIASLTHPGAYGRRWSIDSVEGLEAFPAPALRKGWLRIRWIFHGGLYGKLSVGFFSDEGTLLGRIERVSLRSVDPAMLLRAAGENPFQHSCTEMVWREAPLRKQRELRVQRWLILLDGGDVGRALVEQLRGRGQSVYEVHAAALEGSIEKLDLVLRVSGPFDAVVHLGAISMVQPVSPSWATLNEALEHTLATTLKIIDCLASQFRVPRLWLVTRGSQMGHDLEPTVIDAGLWGLGRVLALERPDIWGGAIDLDSQSDSYEVLRLADVLISSSDEDHIALRQGKEYVARLARVAEMPPAPLEVRSDRTYVVAGASAACGSEVAHWLIKRGAKSIIRIDRSADSRNGESHSSSPSSADVSIYQCTSLDEDSLERILTNAKLPIGGIIYSMTATSGLYRLTNRQAHPSIIQSVHEKLREICAFYAFAGRITLDFFLANAPFPAVLGWEGFGTDAVLAECMNALARHRHQQGQPITVTHIAWPDEYRLTRTETHQQLLAAGIQGMPLVHALAAAECIIATNCPVATAAWVNWDLFATVRGGLARRPLFEHLVTARAATSGTAAVKSRIAQADVHQARQMVDMIVQDHVARILETDAAQRHTDQQRLDVMGLDSLRGLQLLSGIEASLSVKLPQRVLMEYPTIEALSRHVFTLLRPDAEPRVRVDDPVQQEINRGTLVRLRGEGSRRAFFFAPPLHGSGYAFGSIAQHLGSDQPFYSFNAPGVETDRPPCDRIVPIAAGFIEALRVVQPRGPYRIGGYSFGALVAYDMTLKLRQAGEEVEMLVIGDLPALWRANNVISPLLQMARIFNLPIDEPNFQSASLDEQIANTALAIGQVAMLPAGMGESIKQIRVFRAHLHAMHAYHVESCDAPMTLLRAHDTRNGIERVGISAQDPSLGWDAFCTRKVNIRDVPGNHLNAIFLPSAIEFARVLDDVLRQLDTP